MTAGGAFVLIYAAACGWLAWRGSGRIYNAIMAAFWVPFSGFMVVAMFVGRENLDSVGVGWMFLASLPVVAILIWAHR